jgi:hypothetical protein
MEFFFFVLIFELLRYRLLPWISQLIAKNQFGFAVSRACKLVQIEVDSILAEALGVRWGLQLALQRFNH